jgi:hypothetical protein
MGKWRRGGLWRAAPAPRFARRGAADAPLLRFPFFFTRHWSLRRMSTLDLFLPLAKVDLDQRIVQGVATAEVPDRIGEICDYVSTKPYFEA